VSSTLKKSREIGGRGVPPGVGVTLAEPWRDPPSGGHPKWASERAYLLVGALRHSLGKRIKPGWNGVGYTREYLVQEKDKWWGDDDVRGVTVWLQPHLNQKERRLIEAEIFWISEENLAIGLLMADGERR
jgi:hypothetical protein